MVIISSVLELKFERREENSEADCEKENNELSLYVSRHDEIERRQNINDVVNELVAED